MFKARVDRESSGFEFDVTDLGYDVPQGIILFEKVKKAAAAKLIPIGHTLCSYGGKA